LPSKRYRQQPAILFEIWFMIAKEHGV